MALKPVARQGPDLSNAKRVAVSGSPNHMVNGFPVVRVSDTWIGPPGPTSQRVGSATVFTNGLPVARLGDGFQDNDAPMTGSPTVLVGDGTSDKGKVEIVAATIIPVDQNSPENAAKLIRTAGYDAFADEYETSPGTPQQSYPPAPQTSPPPPIDTPAQEENKVPPPDRVTPITDCAMITLPLDYGLRLSARFTLANVSIKTAFPHTIKAQRGLTEQEIVCNLKALAEHILEPLWDAYPGFSFNSGFRTQQNGRSQHETGQAIDVQWPGISNQEYWDRANWVKDNINYDQFIFEHGNRPWLHMSFNRSGNRATTASNKVMTMYQNKYSSGLHRFLA
ncbi:PAAR motif of membrane protein [Pseudomonas phage vB_PpuM-Aura]